MKIWFAQNCSNEFPKKKGMKQTTCVSLALCFCYISLFKVLWKPGFAPTKNKKRAVHRNGVEVMDPKGYLTDLNALQVEGRDELRVDFFLILMGS